MPSSTSVIRLATPSDVPAMLSIYTPYVQNTAVSFEYEPPSLSDFAGRLEERAGALPWIVYEQNGRIAGYAYASRFSGRSGYDWTLESSVYVDAALHGGGIGRKLYDALFSIVHAQGYYNLYACISVPNPESEEFHKKMGFTCEAVLQNSGYKFDGWLNIAFYTKALRPHAPNPVAPIPLALLSPHLLQEIFGQF